jgi:hypothetical protein
VKPAPEVVEVDDSSNKILGQQTTMFFLSQFRRNKILKEIFAKANSQKKDVGEL